MAILLCLTPEVHSADVASERILLGLMCLRREVASELGLELKMQVTLGTIEFVLMRELVMMLGLAVLGVLLGVITLVLTRLTIELFQFLLTFLLQCLLANTTGETRLLDPMLAGPRQTVKRLPADTRAVRREATPTGSVLGEVERHAGQILAREASSAVVAPTTEETFHVLDDVGEEEHPAVDVDAGCDANVGVAIMVIGQDDRVRLGRHPRAIRIDVRGGVGDVHFLQGGITFCSFLCLNPSLPPYLCRSPSSPLLCVSLPIPYLSLLQTSKQHPSTPVSTPLPAKTESESKIRESEIWLAGVEGRSLLNSTQLSTKRNRPTVSS